VQMPVISAAAVPASSAISVPAAPAEPQAAHVTISQSVALGAALLWLLVAGVRGALLAYNLFDLVRIRRSARAWSHAHEYPVFLSDRVSVPLAVGFIHRAILLPTALVEQQAGDAIETIVTHETAHLRRYDVWTNALARVIEAFAALNPFAWFVLRRLSIEREIACDDWVVASSGSGEVFARALAAMASCAGNWAPIAAPSALGSRHSIVERIEQLLEARPRRLRLSFAALAGTLATFALIALVMQSVLPVLAYAKSAPPLQSAQVASGCATPNRGVVEVLRFDTHDRVKTDRFPVPTSTRFLAELKKYPHYREARYAIADVTFDASGKARKVVVESSPSIPDVIARVTRHFQAGTYEPALVNCVAVARTIRTATIVQYPMAAMTQSNVEPVYPEGWSAQHPTACKVPNLVHNGVPSFADSQTLPALSASVRVSVDQGGAVTSATVLKSSGRPAFDNAVLAAARDSRYPLNDGTGFKPVRPNGAMLDWNETHGYSAYSTCAPAPSSYVWNTTYTPSRMWTTP
ncbi:MAG TPA: M56 family metallopeptidase, partial [Candidatus Baltobacteraceae bacterium]|nr:M56 family metallopeptidase [Candidatus Baltobacteraceae bacterium]